jgi:hypothetical protein
LHFFLLLSGWCWRQQEEHQRGAPWAPPIRYAGVQVKSCFCLFFIKLTDWLKMSLKASKSLLYSEWRKWLYIAVFVGMLLWVLQYVMSWYAWYNTFELQFIIGACRYSAEIDMSSFNSVEIRREKWRNSAGSFVWYRKISRQGIPWQKYSMSCRCHYLIYSLQTWF